MEKVFLSRRNLESMSTADLISLADDYGIDIPESLNRSFIIGELLAVADELQDGAGEGVRICDDVAQAASLPQSYNETSVHVLPRNPAWAFVYWDIKESDAQTIHDDFLDDSIFLHVRYFSSMSSPEAEDGFDVHVPGTDRERYVLVSPLGKFFDVQLVVRTGGGHRVLAVSSRMETAPEGCAALQEFPAPVTGMGELDRLSGMEQVLHEHFLNHRQSFS